MIKSVKSIMRAVLPKSSFARNVGILIGGTVGTQFISIAAAPLLTRFFTPEDFGLLAVYSSILGLIVVVASLRYELAIPLPKNNIEAANIAVLSLLLVAFTTVLVLVMVTLLGTWIVDVLGVPALDRYIWLLPVGTLLAGMYTILNYWTVRAEHFGSVAVTNIRQSLLTLGIQLAAHKLGGGALLIGQLAGQSMGVASLARASLTAPEFRLVNWVGVKQAAKQYRRFPLFSTWDAIVNTLGSQLPTLLFASCFSPAGAGLYSFANRVLTLPMSLVGNAVGQVFFCKAPEAYRTNQHGQLVADLQAKLIHIGMPPAVVIVLIGPIAFTLIFGEQWRQAGEFARWMAPWLLLNLIYSPLSTLSVVMAREKQVLVFQLILLLLRALAISLGVWIGDILIAVAIFSVTSAICYFAFAIWINCIAGNSVSKLLTPMLASCAVAIILVIPLIIALVFFEPSFSQWIVILTSTSILIASRYWQLLRPAY